MQWVDVTLEKPPICYEILFTDGRKVYKGWLETYLKGEDLVFFNESGHTMRTECWPDGITHWMKLPELPKKETD